MGKMHQISSNFKENMCVPRVILVVVCLPLVRLGTIEVQEDPQVHNISGTDSNVEMSMEGRIKELRIEMVKLQILTKLNLKEPPRAVAPQSESSKETIQLLLSEADDVQQQQEHHSIDREERLVIHAKESSIPCPETNGSFCRIFQFQLSVSLNASTTDLWIYKTEESFSNALSLSVSYSHSEEENAHVEFLVEVDKIGWNKIELLMISLPRSWNDSFYFLVQLAGQNIEEHGDRRPFLMVSKLSRNAPRRRRDAACDTNESCCLKPLRVSFAEIGFNWVLYPVHLDANMCTGKCRLDHSGMKTHYERAMTKILENDSTLHDSLGVCWTLCCKPKQMESVRVIYNDTDGIIHDQYITELTVKSCSCS